MCCYDPKKKRLIAIRDYLLMLFATEGRVVKKDFAERAQIDNDVAKEMLNQLAVVVHQRHLPPTTVFTSSTSYAASAPPNRSYWQLRLEPDTQFLEKYLWFSFASFARLLIHHSQRYSVVVSQYDDFWRSNQVCCNLLLVGDFDLRFC